MNRSNQGPSVGGPYQVSETVAVTQRSIWRRGRHVPSGNSVLLHSLRTTTGEPRRMLELELERWRRLNTVQLQGETCEVDGELSLVLEDFAGTALVIPDRGLELGVCLDLASNMARCLHRLHELGLLHEDVSPASFLVNLETRRVEFSDLLAVSEEPGGTGAPEFATSLAHLAPERTGRLNRRADHRADYYSFGVTLFQMLTGQLPFTANDPIGWAHAHVSKRAPLVTELAPTTPPVLARLVSKLLSKDPDERYQSSHGLLSDLNHLCESFRRSGELAEFELGTQDVSGRFTVHRAITGRDAELSALRSVVQDLRSGKRRLVLLPGAAGAGKSAVLAEFVQQHVGSSVRLWSTAIEERALGVPLAGLAQALRELAADLLSLSEAELAQLKERVTEALGHNARLLAELVPSLSCITGPSASLVPLTPLEAQRRLQHAFVSFIRVFATPECPVVFVLDDCQWLDAASAEVLSAILTSLDSSSVMVLAAFRGKNVGDVPILSKMAQASRQVKEAVVTVPIGPLPVEAVAEIVAGSLHAPVQEVGELADIVKRKTDGNPFFIGQLLVALHRQQALRLDAERGRWTADLPRAEAHPNCDNVGALMAEQLEELRPEVAQLLSAAACFGMRFELETLSEATGIPFSTCSTLVREALVHRLVSEVPGVARMEESPIADGGRELSAYTFEHSHVQQAALARASEADRATVHARIGRILRRRLGDDRTPHRVFQVLHHCNAARSLIKKEERSDLLELNLLASNQALQSGAWSIAGAHAEVAVELLGGREGEETSSQAFRATLARAETAFLLADPRVDAFCEDAFRLAPDRLARGRVHVLKTRILEHGGHMTEAVVQVRTALAEFGVRLPETPDEINQGMGQGIGKLQAHLARVTIEGLAALPRADDPETRLILELFAQVIPPAFQTNPPLFFLAELLMFDLALSRGVDAVSCKNFADCGIILLAVLGDYDAGYRMGLAAFELLKRFSPTPVESGVCFVFVGFLAHWRASYRDLFAVYDRGEKSGLMLGDLQHVAYAKNDRTQRSFLVGARLRACRDQVTELRRYLTHISAAGQLVNSLVVERAVARLTAGESEREAVAASDQEAVAVIRGEKSTQYCYAFGQAQMLTSFILGDFASAQSWMEFTRDFLMIATGQFSLPDYKLIEGLLAARAHRAGAEKPEALLNVVEENLKQLEAWARLCPENFAHKHHFLAAEHARLTGQPLQVVLAGYREALKTAGDGFMHLRALVHEHQAQTWLALDEPLHARACLEAAYRLYADWGARAKLEQLTREYPALLADVHRADAAALRGVLGAGNGFDSASLLKATQSIFVEVEPERLFAALMSTLIENAGAEHGCLVLRDDSDRVYYVEARAHVERPATSRTQRVPYAGAEFLCPSIVSYVLRTGETVALDDASKASAFQSDLRIKKQGVRSVLCAPIMRQGDVLGALYVENNVSAYAFTRERAGALQVIASQAAISIYNAQLYEDLERRVAQRTEELALKNRQIATMLDHLDEGVFTIDRNRRIEPGYSRQLAEILGTTEIVGRDCLALLLDGSSVRPDVRSATLSALRFSFDQEPWLAALNADHLVRQVERTGPGGAPQFLEIAWNFIASEAGQVERMLVTVRDVTLLRGLRQTAREKEREVDIIVQALERGVNTVQEFCVNCRQLLAANRGMLASQAKLDESALAAAFRNLHTLKGNARLLGFTHLVDALHAAEDAYHAVRRDPSESVERRTLGDHLDSVERVVAEYESVCQQKLSAVINKPDERSETVLAEIRTLVATATSVEATRELLPELRGILARLDQRSLAYLVDETRVMLPSLAAELGKPPPTVVTEHAEVQFAAEWTGTLKDVLIQCFRNSLYHGIESGEERALAGKSVEGRIDVRARTGANAFELQISDDGRGLSLRKLRERSGDGSLSDEAAAEQIFASGTTTAETIGQVAGRGVGLDIVRASLRARGGDAVVRFTGGERDGYRPFVLVLVLPRSALALRSDVRPSLRGSTVNA